MFTDTHTTENAKMADTPPLRKFMFDRSFDGAPGTHAAQERSRAPVTLRPEQIDALKREAHDAGFAAGKVAGVQEHEQMVRVLLAQIDARMGDLLGSLANLHKQQDQIMRDTILAIARKLLPSFVDKHGIDEISSMLGPVIAEMVHEPRLVVRVNESEFDTLNAKINEISMQKAYPGKIVVLADTEIPRGDCRVEWADGGMERNTQATWNNVQQTIAPAGTSGNTTPNS